QDDTLVGLGGNDEFYGGAGRDTYIFGPDFGVDTIFGSGGGGGRIRFEGGITPDDLRFESNGFDLTIFVDDDSVRISDFYDFEGSNSSTITSIEFDSGDIFPITDLRIDDFVYLELNLSPSLTPGALGTAQLNVNVTGIGGLPNADGSTDAQTHLIAVSANGGLVADGLGRNFADTTFVLARGIDVGNTETIDITIKGAAGPLSTLGVTAQLADFNALTGIAARAAAIQPDFIAASTVERLEANLTAQLGTTIGSLNDALSGNAARFGSFGLDTSSATAALAFAIEVAGDFGSIQERGQLGSLGQGWSTIADIGLAIDGDVLELRGLTDIGALQSLGLDAAALYTVSYSASRAVALSGNAFGLSTAARPVFSKGIDGQFRATGGFDGTLTQTSTGYSILTADDAELRFDAQGTFIRMIMADGLQVTASHNAAMQITSLDGPNGAGLSFSRDASGAITVIEDTNGNTATLDYDAQGRLASVTRPDGQSSFAYNSEGDLTQSIAPGDITSAFTFDALGRLSDASYGNGLQTENFDYDGAGGLTVTNGAGNATQIDLLPGNVAGRISNSAGGGAEIIYDDLDNISGVRAPDGTETQFEFDDAGRLTKITDANMAELGFTYSGDGDDPLSFTDAGGNTRSFVYDAGGRITQATWPDGTTLDFNYDAQGNLTGYTNRRGDDVDYTYDARGRLLSETDSSAGPTSYVYDTKGRMTSATNDQGTTQLSYDAADRVVSLDYPTGKSLSFTYNDAGLRASMSDGADYNVFYDYDGLGRLIGLRDADSQIVVYTYDGAGNLISEVNGNGTVSEFTYDSADRLTRIENQAPDASINSFNAYTYDVAGQRLTNESQDGTWTYGYDAIGQLTSASFASTNADFADKALVYEYDASGNRTRVVEDGVATQYVANALNQYTQVGAATFTYDADGNMTSKVEGADTTTYTYDLDNRLTSLIEADGTVLTFAYDIFGNRVGKTVDGVATEYLVDPFGLGDVVSEYSGGTLSATYTHGLGLASAEIGGETAFYDADAVGSVTTLTGTNGAIANSYAYTPFGSELSEVEGLANDFEFNGAFGVSEDSDDLTFMRARSYSSEQARFISEDPLFIRGDPENLYRFALNSPLSFVDATGAMVDNTYGTPAEQVGPERPPVGSGTHDARLGRGSEAGDNFQKDMFNAFKEVGEVVFSAVIGSKVKALKGGIAGIEAALEAYKAFNETPPYFEEAEKVLEDAKKSSDAPVPTRKPVFELTPDTTAEELIKATTGGDTDSPEAAPRPRTGGDPHIQTFDSLGYSFQAVGEFIMFQGTDDDFQFQVRQSPLPNNDLVSVNSAIATMLGNVAVGIYADRDVPLVINGNAVELGDGATIAVGTGSVYRNFNTYIITNEFGDGVVVAVRTGFTDFLTIQNFLAPDRAGNVEGLFGNADGDSQNDLTLRDGTVLTLPIAATELYGAFADAWRITDAESFFDYLDGESTETFTDLNFPVNAVTLDDLDPVDRAAAEQIALSAGLVPGTFEFETTVLDVALSGDPAFADATQDIPAFDLNFDPATDFNTVVPVAVNEAPIAGPDTATVLAGDSVSISVLLNDSDPEGDAIALLNGSDPNGGTVVAIGDQIQFTPAAGFSGTTTVSYELGDSARNIVTGEITIDVTAIDAPRILFSERSGGTLIGGTGDDQLTGSFGNDTITGNAGADLIVDSGGNNVVNAGTGNDRIGLLSGNNTVTGGSDDDLIVGGYDNDTLNGDAGNDVIVGDVSTNVGGADRIAGGTGDDLLEGRGGADTFVFATNDGADTIGTLALDFANPANSTVTGADFQSGVDTILLDGFGITTGVAALAKVSDVAGVATFTDQGTTINFAGLTTADLSVDDFQFL
ncbi:Ig-like domain-containing protein, partial [Yoonia sp. 208BN28-4]|uniref:Ig-like domain-containing protein n=1 Tax=Yoonia sp. 208BN28-4 TaxID=3126505 RepID=UPI00309F47CE